MQTIEYDLNVSGGLMPQINALTAPPTSDESNRRRKLKKSISRQLTNDSNNNSNLQNNRPILSRQTKAGKAPNHEYCDSCREGGDLLCCDRCPNAFHLQCHDPPLDEEDVPQGEWLCRKCIIIARESDDWDDEESDDECDDIESNPKAIQRPFSLLIRAAQTLNPKQFQLPNDLMPSIPLIGTSKKSNKSSHKKQIHELDNNSLVSFPLKLCYQCSKSCRKAPLIQCDYCPLLFHADCLDPPLTCLPMGRWMCPNHSQHVVEQKLLDSVNLSQRIKLWNHFSGNISQDTIKLDFLKKIHRKSHPFRTKIELPQSPKVVVPDTIKQMYKTRPSLLPNINQLSYHLNNSSDDFDSNKLENNCKYERPTPEQQEEWLSSLIAFQSSVAQYMSSSKISDFKSKQSLENPNSNLTINSAKETEMSSKTNDISVKINSQTLNGPTDPFEDSLKKDINSDNKESITQLIDSRPLNGEKGSPSPICSPISDKRISIQNNFSNIETIAEINRLDDSLIRVLAFQRIQQLNTKTVENSNSGIGVQNMTQIQSFPTTIRRIGLTDVKARAVLCPIVIKSSTGSSTGPYILMSYRTLTIGTSTDNDVVLGHYGHCNYVSGKHATIFFDENSRNYELINYSEHGTTVDNVLYSCDFSDKKIYSKNSMVNSQTVTTIKNIANKRKRKSIEDKKLKNSIPTQEMSSDKSKAKKKKTIKSEEIETNAQKNPLKTSKIVFKWSNDSEDLEKVVTFATNPPTMSSKSGQIHKPCACKSSCSSLIGSNGAGWEGTAVLHHGSHLKIGCHQFIFSITSHGITQSQTNHSNPLKVPIKVEPTTK